MFPNDPIQYDPLSMEIRTKVAVKVLKTDYLINKINKLCFFQRSISFSFKHGDQKHTVCRDAIPQPCMNNHLTCVWADDGFNLSQLKSYELTFFHFEDKDRWIVVIPEVNSMDKEGISITLPETCVDYNSRSIIRHPCDKVTLRIAQEELTFTAELSDFHAGAFGGVLDDKIRYPQSYLQVGAIWKTTLSLSKDIIYSGDCKIVRADVHQTKPVVVLSPVQNNIPIQKPKKFRCTRVKLVPPLHINFQHPLTGKTVILDVHEISGSGFSVDEYALNAVLLPGMIIPSLELRLSSIFSIKCSARVIHRRPSDEQHANGHLFVCGIVFTNMNMRDHTKLVAFLQQAKDQRTLVCNSPDMDALWDFFFDTGFIYPKKYHPIHAQQSSIKKTLKKIYRNHPNTSRHFIFQDKGVINGLIALQYVYKYTWMMHHLAARAEARIAGPKVLSQIGSYINDSYCLEANLMKYAIIYYRPENKFPNLVFGGVARNVKDPQICSLDAFAYFHVTKAVEEKIALKAPWYLDTTTDQDLEALEVFYKRISGGLMLTAFDLLPAMVDDTEVSMAYKQDALKRERYLYTLKKDSTPIAIIMILLSDAGINLSDLTNCMHVFLLNPDTATKETLESVLSYLALSYDQETVAVNLFPAEYAVKLSLTYEKNYDLWAYEMQYSDYYYGYLKRISRFFKH